MEKRAAGGVVQSRSVERSRAAERSRTVERSRSAMSVGRSRSVGPSKSCTSVGRSSSPAWEKREPFRIGPQKHSSPAVSERRLQAAAQRRTEDAKRTKDGGQHVQAGQHRTVEQLSLQHKERRKKQRKAKRKALEAESAVAGACALPQAKSEGLCEPAPLSVEGGSHWLVSLQKSKEFKVGDAVFEVVVSTKTASQKVRAHAQRGPAENAELHARVRTLPTGTAKRACMQATEQELEHADGKWAAGMVQDCAPTQMGAAAEVCAEGVKQVTAVEKAEAAERQQTEVGWHFSSLSRCR